MTFSLFLLGLAASLALPYPAAASDSEIPAHAERFVRALQEQRFEDAAAMFKPGDKRAPAGTAAQLQLVSAHIGGFPTMRNVSSLPNGTTLKFEVPSAAPLAPRPNAYHQVAYTATAADGKPVFYDPRYGGTAAARAVVRSAASDA